MKKVLKLILVIFILNCNYVYAYTAHTSNEAIDWLKSQVGKSIDYDGSYGAQCVDLILAYYNYLGVNTVRGNGKDYATNELPSGWTRYENGIPKKGDILVYTNGSYGHVGIYESDSSSYHQNFNHNYVENITRKYNSFNIPYWGVVRPDFNDEEEVVEEQAVEDLGNSFKSQIISGKVNNLSIAVSSNEVGTNVYLDVKDDNNSKQIWIFNKQSDGSYTIKNSYSNLYLTVNGTGNKNKDNVYLSNIDNSDNSSWYIYKYDEGYRLVPRTSKVDKRALDIYGSTIKSGSNIQIYEELYEHNETQTFNIEKYVESIKLDKDNLELVINTNSKLNITYTPTDAYNKSLKWTSSDENIATIDSNGVVTAKGVGTTTISVSTVDGSNITINCNVTVKEESSIFKDVSKNAWYYDSVKYVYDNNIIKGYANGNFGPNDNLTRAMLVTILHRMENEVLVSNKNTFSDVSNTWYTNAINWASDKNIVMGYGDGTFKPNKNITRQELMVILYRYAKYKGKDMTSTSDISTYSDYNKIDDYAKEAMKWGVSKKILYGNKDGLLNPKGNATRAEVAAIIERYMKNV